MSNAAYVLYLQQIQADNTAKSQQLTATANNLQLAQDGLTQQIAAYGTQISDIQGQISQLEASNALINSLISYLLQAAKNGR